MAVALYDAALPSPVSSHVNANHALTAGSASREGRLSPQAPAWVQAGTSMRLVQKAAGKGISGVNTPTSWAGSQGGHKEGSAGFEQAPWMGHGGVRHMDAGHLGQCSSGCTHVSHLCRYAHSSRLMTVLLHCEACVG